MGANCKYLAQVNEAHLNIFLTFGFESSLCGSSFAWRVFWMEFNALLLCIGCCITALICTDPALHCVRFSFFANLFNILASANNTNWSFIYITSYYIMSFRSQFPFSPDQDIALCQSITPGCRIWVKVNLFLFIKSTYTTFLPENYCSQE